MAPPCAPLILACSCSSCAPGCRRPEQRQPHPASSCLVATNRAWQLTGTAVGGAWDGSVAVRSHRVQRFMRLPARMDARMDARMLHASARTHSRCCMMPGCCSIRCAKQLAQQGPWVLGACACVRVCVRASMRVCMCVRAPEQPYCMQAGCCERITQCLARTCCSTQHAFGRQTKPNITQAVRPPSLTREGGKEARAHMAAL